MLRFVRMLAVTSLAMAAALVVCAAFGVAFAADNRDFLDPIPVWLRFPLLPGMFSFFIIARSPSPPCWPTPHSSLERQSCMARLDWDSIYPGNISGAIDEQFNADYLLLMLTVLTFWLLYGLPYLVVTFVSSGEGDLR